MMSLLAIPEEDLLLLLLFGVRLLKLERLGIAGDEFFSK